MHIYFSQFFQRSFSRNTGLKKGYSHGAGQQERSLWVWRLLRIVDPKSESKTLDDYSLAYIPIAPVEIMLVTFAPMLVLSSQGFVFVAITFAFAFVIYLMAIKNKWLNRKA